MNFGMYLQTSSWQCVINKLILLFLNQNICCGYSFAYSLKTQKILGHVVVRRVVVSYKLKYVHKALVSSLVKLAQEKVWLGELTVPTRP